MGDNKVYDILSLDENNVFEARNIKAPVPVLVDHQPSRQTNVSLRNASQQQHRSRTLHPGLHDPDVAVAPGLSRPLPFHTPMSHARATVDTSGGGIVASVLGINSSQIPLSLGHLRQRFDSIDAEQTGFIRKQQFTQLADSLGMVVTPSMIAPRMTFNVFARHYYASQDQQRRTSFAGRNRHLHGRCPRHTTEDTSGSDAEASPSIDLSPPRMSGGDDVLSACSSPPPYRHHISGEAQTTDDLPISNSGAQPRHGLPARSATVTKISGHAFQALRPRVRTPVTAYPNLAAPSLSPVLLKPSPPTAVGAIPALVHADISDEDNPIGVGNYVKRSLRKDAISSDEEGPRPPLYHYHRFPRASDAEGGSLFAPISSGLTEDEEIKNSFTPTHQSRNSHLQGFSVSPVGVGRRMSGYSGYTSDDNDIDLSKVQITFSKTGKPLTPLPDLRAPLLAKGVGAVDVTKRHRGHMNRIWEHHAAAVINGVHGGGTTVDTGQNSVTSDNRTPGSAVYAHGIGDAIDFAGMDENKINLPFVLNPSYEQRTSSKPVVLEPKPSIAKHHKKKSHKRKNKRRHSTERKKERYFDEAGLDEGGTTGLHTLLQEVRQTRRSKHQDHYIAKDRQTLTPLTQMEGLVRTKSGLVTDILDENTEGTNDETADKVVAKSKTAKVGRLLSPLVHKAAKDSSIRERESRRRSHRRKRRSPSLRKMYRGADDGAEHTASPKARKQKGAARIDGPQLLGVYGRALDSAVDPLVVMGVHEAELYDPNESSLEQSEIQSRLRLWQERQEQIERQQQELRAMMHEEQAQKAFGDRFWGCSQPLVIDGKKKPILTL